MMILHVLISMLFNKINKLINQIIKREILSTKIYMKEIAKISLKISEFLFWTNFSFEVNGFNLKKSTIFIAQHQSFIEELISMSYTDPSFAYSEDFERIPLIGILAKYLSEKLNFVSVGSSKEGSANSMLDSINRSIDSNKSFLFYPEGKINEIDNQNIKAMPGGMIKVLNQFFQTSEKQTSISKLEDIPIICTNTGLLFQGKTRVRSLNQNIQSKMPKDLKIEVVAKITKNGIEFLDERFQKYFEKKMQNYEKNLNLIENELINLTGKKYELSNKKNFLKEIENDLNNFDTSLKNVLIDNLKKQKDVIQAKYQEEKNKSFFQKNTRLIVDYEEEIKKLDKQIDDLTESAVQKAEDKIQKLNNEKSNLKNSNKKIKKLQQEIQIATKALEQAKGNVTKAPENAKNEIKAILNLYKKYNTKNDFNFSSLTTDEKINFCRKEFDFIIRAYNERNIEQFGDLEMTNYNQVIFSKDNDHIKFGVV